VERALGDSGVACFVAMPGSIELLTAIRDRLGSSLTFVSDPAWRMHDALGLVRASAADVFLSPATWRSYASGLGSGRLRAPRQDVFRLGGAAIVNPGGVVSWLYRSRSTTDYVDPALLATKLVGE
jgi:hypothetical protein